MQEDSAQPIRRGEGLTRSERYLKRLCDSTFLSLWSYPGVYRDQGPAGKEVCDLLVVFENHVVIFSDKHCEFPDTGDLRKDWARWFRRAVWTSAQQLYGAERWIKSHGDRLFLDSACAERFPIDLPDPSRARFHRVVVAHGVSERCRKELGGSGSLMIAPRVVGKAHYDEAPFTVGQMNPARGFVHVLDDTTLDVVLTTLDTITDFTGYLERKERFIESGRLIYVAGEDDLLGYYVREINEEGAHDFVFPDKYQGITLEEGFWEGFLRSPERQRQIQADKISYAWDRLIEMFVADFASGGVALPTPFRVNDLEKALRFLARESRLRRRMLAKALLELVERTPPNERGTRLGGSPSRGDPCYVFLAFPRTDGKPGPEHFEERRAFLAACCMVAKLHVPAALDMVGIATESGRGAGGSADLLYWDMRDWTAQDQEDAKRLQAETGLLRGVRTYGWHEREYVDPADPERAGRYVREGRLKGRDRNAPCPCGSGRKCKRCCGRR